MKTHYQALGINEDADDEVIVAAYKALAKKYHPDTYSGDKKFAEERIKEINVAYGVLSDKVKRKKYDEDIKNDPKAGEFDYGSEFDGNKKGEAAIKEDWAIVIQIYPEAEYCREYIFTVSAELSFTYQVIVINKKVGDKASLVASGLLRDFLEKYFGTNEKLKELALQCLIAENREIAKDINKKISVLGTHASSKILEDINQRFAKEIQNFNSQSQMSLDDYLWEKGMPSPWRKEKEKYDKWAEEHQAQQEKWSRFRDEYEKKPTFEEAKKEYAGQLSFIYILLFLIFSAWFLAMILPVIF